MSIKFNKLAYDSVDDFVYGSCKKPVITKSGLIIGGGEVYPELNFTLPSMIVNEDSIKDAYQIYKVMTNGILNRARELYAPGVVIEYETLPEFTENPKWGIEVSKIIVDTMKEYEAKYGLKSAYRATPNDLREMNRPPIMRSGKYWEAMIESFAGCSQAGADFISVESTGGKELNDEALVNADIKQVIFALGVCGCRDMKFLWKNIADICKANGSLPAGDSACGFGNTAMVLAERGMIPKVFAAVVRVATVARALAAFEEGAVGPSKDCAYEGIYLKAITGSPISCEGKSAACAHLSPIGNIAAAVTDLWSNESVQQVKLLAEMAPVVSIEQLIYDTRLMNTATKKGFRREFRDLLAESDAPLDPQAYVLKPQVVFDIAGELVKAENSFEMTKLGAKLALDKITEAVNSGEVYVEEREKKWLDIIGNQIEDIVDDELEFYDDMQDELDMDKFIPAEYGL